VVVMRIGLHYEYRPFVQGSTVVPRRTSSGKSWLMGIDGLLWTGSPGSPGKSPKHDASDCFFGEIDCTLFGNE
jgi:hypothetical protein